MDAKTLATTWPTGALLGGVMASLLVALLLPSLDGLNHFRLGFATVLWTVYGLRWGIAVYQRERSRVWIFYVAMIIVGLLRFEALLN